MTNFNIYTKAELIQKLKKTRFSLTTKQAECDDWHETANMARHQRDALEVAHKDALDRLERVSIACRKARAHRDRLLDERDTLQAELQAEAEINTDEARS